MSTSARVCAHLRNNIVGYVALFCALTIAPAFAASLPKNSVTTKQIKNGEVKTKDVAANAIDGSKLVDGSVGSDDLATGSVGVSEMANDSVNGSALADLSVASSNVINETLTGDDVQEGSLDNTVLQSRIGGACSPGFAIRAVTINGGVNCEDLPDDNPTGPAGGVLGGNYPNPTMAPDAVVTANITNDAVTSAKIQTNTLDNTDIGANAVQTSELAANTVGNSHMADNAIGNAEMADNAVQHDEMADQSVAGAEVINGSLTTSDMAVTNNTATIGGGTLPANSCTQSDIDTNVTIGNDIIMLTPKFGAAPLGGVVTWPRKNPADAADVFEATTCNFSGVDSVLPQTIDWALISQP